MTRSDWLDLTVLERKKYNLLSEVMDLSQQLGEALVRTRSCGWRRSKPPSGPSGTPCPRRSGSG